MPRSSSTSKTSKNNILLNINNGFPNINLNSLSSTNHNLVRQEVEKLTQNCNQHTKTLVNGLVVDIIHLGNVRKYNHRLWELGKGKAPNKLIKTMEDINSQGGSFEDKARKLNNEMEHHFFRPALTAHPTNPRSIEADNILHDIAQKLGWACNLHRAESYHNKNYSTKLNSLANKLSLSNNTNKQSINKALYQNVIANIELLNNINPLVKGQLTVGQEVHRKVEIYGGIVNDYPKFKKQVIDDFARVLRINNDIEKEQIARIIDKGIRKQFDNIHSWAATDADGNDKVTTKTGVDAINTNKKHFKNNKHGFNGPKQDIRQTTKVLEQLNQEEINRLKMARDNNDFVVRYRLSDANPKTPELIRKLQAINPHAHYITLCETPDDVRALPKITKSMLESGTHKNNEITLFPGYSDLEKRGGLYGLLLISDHLNKTISVINQYDPNIKIHISHGHGADIARQSNRIVKDATHQGEAAAALKFSQYRKNYMYNCIGNEDDFMKGLKEIKELKPHLRKTFDLVMNQGIKNFEKFVSHKDGYGDITAKMIQETTHPSIKNINKSSRKAAKSSKSAPKAINLDSLRAIGFSEYFSASGTQAHVLMGQININQLDSMTRSTLPDLFAKSHVVQDIQFKMLHALVISDFDRGWRNLGIEKPSINERKQLEKEYESKSSKLSVKHSLAAIEQKSYDVLNSVVHFMPLNENKRNEISGFINKAQNNGNNINKTTLAVMKSVINSCHSNNPELCYHLNNVISRANLTKNRVHNTLSKSHGSGEEFEKNYALAVKEEQRLLSGPIESFSSRLAIRTPQTIAKL